MNKILTVIVVLFSVQSLIAADPTPPPPTPPPPPGLSIEVSPFLVVCFVLVLGYYFTKKYALLKKGL